MKMADDEYYTVIIYALFITIILFGIGIIIWQLKWFIVDFELFKKIKCCKKTEDHVTVDTIVE